MGRRRPRERRAATALLTFVLSRSTARALCPASLARTSNALLASGARPPVVGASGASSLPCGRAVHRDGRAATTVSGEGAARSCRLQAAGYGTAFGTGRSGDDDGDSDGDEQEGGNESDAAAAAAAATAGAEARTPAAPAAPAAPSELGNHSEGALKNPLLHRIRRRSKAKIKATPAAAALDHAASPRAKRAAAASGNGSIKEMKNKKRRLKAKGRNINMAGGGGRSGSGRGGDLTGEREPMSWPAAVCSAVFGTPARLVQRRVDACKSFVASRERVHWASLGMAVYILTTSVVPRLGTG